MIYIFARSKTIHLASPEPSLARRLCRRKQNNKTCRLGPSSGFDRAEHALVCWTSGVVLAYAFWCHLVSERGRVERCWKHLRRRHSWNHLRKSWRHSGIVKTNCPRMANQINQDSYSYQDICETCWTQQPHWPPWSTLTGKALDIAEPNSPGSQLSQLARETPGKPYECG